MNKEMILEGNKLIAEFMGGKYDKDTTFKIQSDEIWLPIHGIVNCSTIESGKGRIIQYHTSWDWLMPAIEKISNIRNFLYPDGIYKFLVNVKIEITTKAFLLTPSYHFPPDMDEPTVPTIEYYEKDLITNCWLGVIQFIKWYNQLEVEK